MSGVVGTGYVVTFAARNGNGTPRTGLVAGDFTVTVRNPGDTASNNPAVSEVGGGMYRFTIPGAFTTTHGVGEYGYTIDLTTAPRDIAGGFVEFFDAGFDDIAFDVWEEILTGATHNVATSAGRRLRELAEFGQLTAGTAQAGAATTITLDAGESAIDDFYRFALIGINGGTGENQIRIITAYDGTTKIATVDRAWAVNPNATSEYVIGLNAASVPTDDTLNVIRDAILSDATPFPGANVDAAISTRATQAQILSDATPFAGANINASITSRESEASAAARAATNQVEHDATQAAIAALNNPTVGAIADAVWDEPIAGHLTPGSTGANLAAAGAGGDPAAIADAVWDEVLSGHLTAGSTGAALNTVSSDTPSLRYQGAIHIDTLSGAAGTAVGTNGTPENPVDNLADAVTLAAAVGLRRYRLRGVILLATSHDGWVFEGAAGEANININGQDVSESLFLGCQVSGVVGTGPIRAEDCLMDGVTFAGVALRCRFVNTTVFSVGTSTLIGCASEVPGTSTPIFDLVGAGRSLNSRAYSGGMEIRNVSDAGQSLSLEFVAGQAVLAASCTAGTITLRGVGNLTDSSAGATVETNAYLNLSDIRDAILLFAADAGDGGKTVLDVVQYVHAMTAGRFVRTDISATVTRFEFFERDGTTSLYTMEITDGTGNGRERLSG
jgi:hypothetical protein